MVSAQTWNCKLKVWFLFKPADSTDVVTSHQESHDFGDQQQQQQQQQQQYDSNQYYDQYQQQQHYDVDGSHAQQPQQHVYEQVHQENNQNQVSIFL